MGIEPTYPVWKTGALADVLIPHKSGASREDAPEKIGTLKKGEKIFSLFPIYIIQKIF